MPTAKTLAHASESAFLAALRWAGLMLALTDVIAAVSTAMQDNLPGTWELRPTTTPGMVHLRLAEGNNTHGTNVPIASLEGLTEAQLAGAGGPVQFRITRDAGGGG